MREGKSRADMCGELGRIAARAEQPDRRQRHVGRHRGDLRERMAGGKALALEQQHLLEAVEEIVLLALGVLAPAQRQRGDLVGTGRAP
jgi:hypothetical protein